jgi:hypothetical protein
LLSVIAYKGERNVREENRKILVSYNNMMYRDQVVTFGPETLEMCPEIHRTGLHK